MVCGLNVQMSLGLVGVPPRPDVDRVGARGVIGVSHRLAVDNIRDSVDNPIPPVHRRVEHATSGIATDRESDGEVVYPTAADNSCGLKTG